LADESWLDPGPKKAESGARFRPARCVPSESSLDRHVLFLAEARLGPFREAAAPAIRTSTEGKANYEPHDNVQGIASRGSIDNFDIKHLISSLACAGIAADSAGVNQSSTSPRKTLGN
jgi:hypothetical protein